ncbi:MAG TPA: TatD family hydrolase [Methanobacterium sp.]|jgi:hypothetical protein|nr:MAG: hypothetical protein FGO69_01850 [Methanobacterium sp.]HOI70734.1 TatD family hydrolase [Methanobacterium sp.]
MIDGHIHADCRPYEDFKSMAVAGIETAITCAHDPMRMSTSAVVLDHIHRILNNDFKRAADCGLMLYSAVGIHPRSISPDYQIVLDELPSLLADDQVVAIGEIGLETTAENEKTIFIKQLKLADELGMKVIVHTPRTNKREVARESLSIIDAHINQSQVQIDHVDNSIIDLVVDFKGLRGITVQPQKMTPLEAVKLLVDYGTKGFALNSDISSSPSDPLSVPKTALEMKLAGFNDSDVKKVSMMNVSQFFGF